MPATLIGTYERHAEGSAIAWSQGDGDAQAGDVLIVATCFVYDSPYTGSMTWPSGWTSDANFNFVSNLASPVGLPTIAYGYRICDGTETSSDVLATVTPPFQCWDSITFLYRGDNPIVTVAPLTGVGSQLTGTTSLFTNNGPGTPGVGADNAVEVAMFMANLTLGDPLSQQTLRSSMGEGVAENGYGLSQSGSGTGLICYQTTTGPVTYDEYQLFNGIFPFFPTSQHFSRFAVTRRQYILVPGPTNDIYFDTFSTQDEAAVAVGSGSWTHTPSNGPEGILVFLAARKATPVTRIITAVTYGGVPLTEVPLSPVDITSAGTYLQVSAWFGGSGLSPFSQTIAYTSSAAVGIGGVGISFHTYSGNDMAVEDTAIQSIASTLAPSVTLTTTRDTVVAGIVHTGIASRINIQSDSGLPIYKDDFGIATDASQYLPSIQPAGSPVLSWTVLGTPNGFSATPAIAAALGVALYVIPSSVFDVLSTIATIDHDLLIGVEEDQHHTRAHYLDENGHTGGLFYKTGVHPVLITDADFINPADGMVAIAYGTERITGITHRMIWVRANSAWKAAEA